MVAPHRRAARGLPVGRLAGGAGRQRGGGLPLDAVLRLRRVHRLRHRARRVVAGAARRWQPGHRSGPRPWRRAPAGGGAGPAGPMPRWGARDGRGVREAAGALRQARQAALHQPPRRGPDVGAGAAQGRPAGRATAPGSRPGPSSASAWPCRPGPSRPPSTSMSSSPDGSTRELARCRPADGGAARRLRRASRGGAARPAPRPCRTRSRRSRGSWRLPAVRDVGGGRGALAAAAELPLERERKGQRRADDVRPAILDRCVPAADDDARARAVDDRAGPPPGRAGRAGLPGRRTDGRPGSAHASMDRTRRHPPRGHDAGDIAAIAGRRCARRSGRRMRKERPWTRPRPGPAPPPSTPTPARPEAATALTAARRRGTVGRRRRRDGAGGGTARPASVGAAARAAVSVDASRAPAAATTADGEPTTADASTTRPPRVPRAACREGRPSRRGGRAGARAQAADRRHPPGAGRGRRRRDRARRAPPPRPAGAARRGAAAVADAAAAGPSRTAPARARRAQGAGRASGPPAVARRPHRGDATTTSSSSAAVASARAGRPVAT